nr:putative disease resistance RPP13-like protein 1 [Populus alba]
MGKLTKLRILESYIVGKESGSSMKELGKLSHIRKTLSIRNLRDVANAQDALDADLKGKKKIEELGLMWGGNMDDTRHEREVLERLEPSENVKQLFILGYGGYNVSRLAWKLFFLKYGTVEYFLDGDLRHIEGTGGWRPLSEKTTPLVNESLVYGRDADKEAIMEHLLTQHNTDGSNLRAVPIVGMGGIGKTALAQLIYNDEKVDQCFQLKAWVWASQQFDVARIIKEILDKINASTCRTKEPDESLMEAVKGKKLLLVLDDAWNIEYNEWDKLLLPLRYVEQGSKIVVTTRDEDVAKVIQTVIPSHRLNVISDEDCWKLFARVAFSGVNSGAVSSLEAFGREIVKKCKGLPLAAKTLGGLLHSVGDVKQWEKISNSSLWGSSNENIPPALTLSYYYLPSHLKRCFAYCAIFPKGYVFKKDGLITEWMAQGFLVQPRGVEGMEDIGEKYFDDLVSRSLFQQSTLDSFFSMHDLISDLAEYALGEFCFKLGINESGSRLEGEHSCSLPERTRYLSITSAAAYGEGLRIFRSIHGVQHWRTLFPLRISREVDIEALNDILPNLKHPIMAVEFIGGTIPSAVIEVLGEKLTIPEILGFFKSHKPSDDLLGKLKETLNTLNGLLSDGLLGKLKETHINI